MQSPWCRLRQKVPVFLNRGHPISSIERLGNKTNQQISCCYRMVMEFVRRVEGRFLVKGNKDERICNEWCDGEKNVHWWEKVNLWCNPLAKDGVHSSSTNVFMCSTPSELCCRHCSVFVSFSLYWGNWQQEMFRLNSIHRATMTEISFNKHIKTSSSAFAHSKCVNKLSVVPRIWFLFSGTCDEPLVWNSSKRQIERHLWYHFFHMAKNYPFLADRPLEPVGGSRIK